MIQSVINGIIAKIRTKYDKSYRIYDESTEQGLTEPCFSVLCLKPSGVRQVRYRFQRFFPFMITYFPSTDEPIAECNAVCETLLELLCDITTDIGVLHSFEMSGEIVDGNLQFSIQYSIPTMLLENLETMADVIVDTGAE